MSSGTEVLQPEVIQSPPEITPTEFYEPETSALDPIQQVSML